MIDISPLLTPNPSHTAIRSVKTAWDRALSSIGFAAISGHGVDEHLIQSLAEKSRAFFSAPLEKKLEYSCKLPQFAPSGYTAMGSESAVRAMVEDGDVQKMAQAPPDLLESIIYWTHAPRAAGFKPVPAELRAEFQEYMRVMDKLAAHLLRLCAMTLGLRDENFFAPLFKKPVNVLKLAHYPGQVRRWRWAINLTSYLQASIQPIAGQMRYAAHSDYVALTVLHQDTSVGGLEVLNRATDEWYRVPTRPHALIVNGGEMLERWSNGRWRAGWHRVVNPGSGEDEVGTSRLSILYFTVPSEDVVVEPLEECVRAMGGVARYGPLRAGERVEDKEGRRTE